MLNLRSNLWVYFLQCPKHYFEILILFISCNNNCRIKRILFIFSQSVGNVFSLVGWKTFASYENSSMKLWVIFFSMKNNRSITFLKQTFFYKFSDNLQSTLCHFTFKKIKIKLSTEFLV